MVALFLINLTVFSFTVFLSCFEILCLCPGSYCPLVSSSLHCIALNLKVHQKSLIKSAISPIDNRPSVHQYNLSSTRAGLIYRFHSGLRSSHAKLQNLNFPVVFTIPQWIWGNWLGKVFANKRRVTVTPFLPPSSPPTSPDLGTVGDGFSLKWLTNSPSSAYRCSPQPHHAPPTPHPPSASIDAYLVRFGSTRMSISYGQSPLLFQTWIRDPRMR